MRVRMRSGCCRSARLTALLVLLTLLAAACRAGADGSGGDAALSGVAAADRQAYEPYDEPITMRIAYRYSDITLPQGDTNDNNFLTRYLSKKTGINVKYAWEANDEDQYNSKLALSILSGDLPDAFVAGREQFRQLVRNNMLEDLTEVYPAYASTLVKSIYEATGGKALDDASVDGKLYGLPNVAIEADAPSYVWVRQDWLDRLRLEPPRTASDIAWIAKAFAESDPDGNGKADTIGIPLSSTLLYDEKMGLSGLNSVFAAFGAYPRHWVEGSDGGIVYGSIAPEAKQALSLVADWYRDGVIDRKFALRKEPDELIKSNQAGLFFGPWWAPYYPLSASVQNDTKAEWRVFAAPLDASGSFNVSTAPSTDRYLVIRKGYPHPEAALKLLNAFTKIERNVDTDEQDLHALNETAEQMGVQLRNYYPFDLLLDHPDAVVRRHDSLVLALEGKTEPELLDVETRRLYDSAILEQESPRKNMEAWSASQAYLLGGAVSKTSQTMKQSLFFGTTPTMSERWDELRKLEQETYLKIITGELPVEAFDRFAADWKASGGDRITREVAGAIGRR